jgi:PKD repeat protein
MVFSIACLLACGKRKEDPSPAKAVPPPIDKPLPRPGETDAAAIDTPSGAPDSFRLEFTSHPPSKAYPGHAYAYRPVLSRPGAFRLKVLQAPDSAFRAVKDQITWLPSQEGRYPVTLEAVLVGGGGTGSGSMARQTFFITVDKVLKLSLKPLPDRVDKGDSVIFDLRGSEFPAWAAEALTVRFDYDGDGNWDSEALPLATNLVQHHAYPAIGNYSPRVEAHYRSWETRKAEGRISVVSAVTAVLKIPRDTLEPGAPMAVDASGSKGDGRLVYALDADGDGKTDWTDSSTGKGSLAAPKSGTYQAVLTVRNAMGQEGKAMAPLRVNARMRLDFKLRNPKENMSAPVEIKVRALDADDSLAQARVNFTGEAGAWEIRTTPPDSAPSAHEWWLRFKHAYGKAGKYAPSVCVSSKDGREICRTASVEIFNALPVCQPGPDLRATLAQPMDIDGTGSDADGTIVKWEWDLDGDGKYDLVSSANGKFRYTFSKVGVFPLVLRVTTADGVSAVGSRKVEVRKKWKG